MFTSFSAPSFVLFSALAAFSVVSGSPISLLRRAGVIPDGPKFVVYTDADIGGGNVLPPLDQIQGFNVV